MKHVVTVICSLVMLIFGILLSLNNEALTNYKSIRAAPPPTFKYIDRSQLPLDLQLGHQCTTTVVRDTIHDTIPLAIQYDTIPVVKYKTKYKVLTKIVQDSTVRKTDTLYVPVVTVNVPLRKEVLNDSTHHYIHYVDTCVVRSNNTIR